MKADKRNLTGDLEEMYLLGSDCEPLQCDVVGNEQIGLGDALKKDKVSRVLAFIRSYCEVGRTVQKAETAQY